MITDHSYNPAFVVEGAGATTINGGYTSIRPGGTTGTGSNGNATTFAINGASGTSTGTVSDIVFLNLYNPLNSCMLKLNAKNGHIEIGDILIFPEFSLSGLDQISENHQIVKMVVNEGYVSYSIPNADNGEFSLYLIFYLERLSSLGLALGSKYQFPPWEITGEEIFQLEQKLKSIGGSHTYNWGRVSLSEDRKGGIVSIVIAYNKSQRVK